MKKFIFKISLFLCFTAIWSCSKETVQTPDSNLTTMERNADSEFLPIISASEYYEMLESGESEDMFDLKLTLLSYGLYDTYMSNIELGDNLTNTLFLNFPCDGYYDLDDVFENFRMANPGGFNDEDLKNAINIGIAKKIEISDSESESIDFVEEIMASLIYDEVLYPTTLFISNFQFHSKQYFEENSETPHIGPGVEQIGGDDPKVFVFQSQEESDLDYLEINQNYANENLTILLLNGDPVERYNNPCGPSGNGGSGGSGGSSGGGGTNPDPAEKKGTGFAGLIPQTNDKAIRITDMTINDDFEGFWGGKQDVVYQARLYYTLPAIPGMDVICTDGCGHRYLLDKVQDQDIGTQLSVPNANHTSIINEFWSDYNRIWLVIYEHDDWPYSKKTLPANPNLSTFTGTTDIEIRAKFVTEVYFNNQGALETGLDELNFFFDFLNPNETKTLTQNGNSFVVERIQ